MNLPSKEDINPFPDDLDGQCAVVNFLGKTREQITAEFSEHGSSYQEDLMFMGSAAFRFYFKAAADYIHSAESAQDGNVVDCLCGVIEFRLEHEFELIREMGSEIVRFADCVLENYEKFEVNEDIYGDIRQRLHKLKAQLDK